MSLLFFFKQYAQIPKVIYGPRSGFFNNQTTQRISQQEHVRHASTTSQRISATAAPRSANRQTSRRR